MICIGEMGSYDQVGPLSIIELQYEFGSTQGQIEVGLDWLLSNVREELAFTVGLTTEGFILYILKDGQTPLKVFIRLTLFDYFLSISTNLAIFVTLLLLLLLNSQLDSINGIWKEMISGTHIVDRHIYPLYAVD